MSTRIRLTRRGRKKLALYDIVVADSRAPRDGRFIEKIGSYNPNTDPATIEVVEDKALDWLMKGAQPSDTVRAMLSYKGLLLKKHLKTGVLKGAISEEEADAKFEEWKKGKAERIGKKVAGLDKKKAEDKKAKFEAETKVNVARAEAIKKKSIVEEAPKTEDETAPVVEGAADAESGDTEATKEDVKPETEETPVTEAQEDTTAGEKTDEPTAEEAAKDEAQSETEATPVTEVQEAAAVEDKTDEPAAKEPANDETQPETDQVPVAEAQEDEEKEEKSDAAAIEETAKEEIVTETEEPAKDDQPVAENSDESPSEEATKQEGDTPGETADPKEDKGA